MTQEHDRRTTPKRSRSAKPSAEDERLTEVQRERMHLLNFVVAKWRSGCLSNEQYDSVCAVSGVAVDDRLTLETPLPTIVEFVKNNRQIRNAILTVAPELAAELRAIGSQKSR
jgi:hypothetical protein